ncbi:MAG: hypothetical protein IJ574_03430 [Bacilli bacterium]|nr:hypothetical protein [Bacilli bacterium]
MKINSSLEYLLLRYKENKLSQSNLIVTDDIDKCVSELKIVVKNILCSDTFSASCDKCNICHLIDENSLSNFIVIEPDGAAIKKEQVSTLMNKFMLKPDLVNNNVFIIKNAEKLNASSSNTMLKFIEEPSPYNIGFLVTNNINAILPTIISRCQITKVNYNEEIIEDEEIIDLASVFVDKIENDYYNALFFVKENLLSKDYDKDRYILLLRKMLDIYYEVLVNKINEFKSNNDNFMYLNNLNYDILNKKVQILTGYLDRLNYNVNMNLFFDSLIVEMR